MSARLPDTIGRFKILSILGRGAMGVVYKAQDPLIDRIIAIKVIREDLLAGPDREDYLARFHDEAKIAALCRHDNIVGVHELGFEGEDPYLVLEYVDGIPLSRAVPHGAPVPSQTATQIAVQVLDALAEMHGQGVTHCDIKPANILITRSGRLKITDFGISRLNGSPPAGAPLMIGTPSYMSPEQCLGQSLDHRSDFFSLGAVLYELMAGERPFQGLAYTDTVFKLINQPHHALRALQPDVPTAVSDIIDRALAKKPEGRFADADHFTEAFRPLTQAGDAAFALPALQNLSSFERSPPSIRAHDAAQTIGTVRWAASASCCGDVETDQAFPLAQPVHHSPLAEPPKQRHHVWSGLAHLALSTRQAIRWPRMVANALWALPLGYRPQRGED